jgi:hypothetical protein
MSDECGVMNTETLTVRDVLSGAVNVDHVSAADLAAFIAAEKLDVKPRKSKRDTLNAICDALEERAGNDEAGMRNDECGMMNDEASVTGDPVVDGSNYLKRRAKAIAAGRGALGQIPSNLSDEAKKSSYIARRFKSNKRG